MELILWRHAEAEPGEPDLGRRLTGKGEKQARRMADWLHARLPEATRILVSPAARAQQTAAALAEVSGRKLKTMDSIAPGASADDLLAAAGWPDGKAPVLIVGHQPALGEVAAQLLAGSAGSWPIRKAGVWWIAARPRDEGEQILLRAVMGPDLL